MPLWHSTAYCLCAWEILQYSCTSLVSNRLLFLFHHICRFSSADVQPFALQLLNALLAKIEAQQSPERVAENDFLMRCALVISFLK
jgi:exportin-2 (importin alpha re-exporter)